MSLPDGTSSLKRLRNRYRLVVLNEDTFEEVVAFKLTRWSVYVALSVSFIVLVGLTIALVAFTPLKLYIPGYGEADKTKEMETLKLKSDSIEHLLILNQQYVGGIEKVLKGNIIPKDTTTLKLISTNNALVPKAIKKKKK
ncbi:MAG: hypothetical protein Q8891_07330 [Bacteroidota bacterium]|nr:hypothetical protein [Bacteroidota bacterium]